MHPTLLLLLPALALSASIPVNLTTTAAYHGPSVLECWQLPGSTTTSTGGALSKLSTTQLGPLANGSYSVIPANTDLGVHVAPVAQYVIFLTGAALITLPAPSSHPKSTTITSGGNGLFFAADTAALSTTGHGTAFTEDTVFLQIPVANGVVPIHKVLYGGPCRGAELGVGSNGTGREEVMV